MGSIYDRYEYVTPADLCCYLKVIAKENLPAELAQITGLLDTHCNDLILNCYQN